MTFSQPREGPQIKHLAFADDRVVFTSRKRGAIRETIRTLERYEKQSGQLINRQKSVFLSA